MGECSQSKDIYAVRLSSYSSLWVCLFDVQNDFETPLLSFSDTFKTGLDFGLDFGLDWTLDCPGLQTRLGLHFGLHFGMDFG